MSGMPSLKVFFFFFLNKFTERGKKVSMRGRQRERGGKRERERKTGMNE